MEACTGAVRIEAVDMVVSRAVYIGVADMAGHMVVEVVGIAVVALHMVAVGIVAGKVSLPAFPLAFSRSY